MRKSIRCNHQSWWQCLPGLCFAGWIFLLLTKSPRCREWNPWRCAKAGGVGHKAAFQPPEISRAKPCSQNARLRATPRGHVALGTFSESNILFWNLTKTNSWWCIFLFPSPRFSQSPNENFRMQQRSGTLRPWSQRSQTRRKTVRPNNKVRSTIKTLLKCPGGKKKILNNHLLQWRPEGHWQKLTLCHVMPSLIPDSKLLLIWWKRAKWEHDFMALICLEEVGYLFYDQIKKLYKEKWPSHWDHIANSISDF